MDKTISEIEMRLAAARAAQATSQGMSPSDSEGEPESMQPRVSYVMGIFTTFANRKRRDSIRQTWMPQGLHLSMFVMQYGSFCLFSPESIEFENLQVIILEDWRRRRALLSALLSDAGATLFRVGDKQSK